MRVKLIIMKKNYSFIISLILFSLTSIAQTNSDEISFVNYTLNSINRNYDVIKTNIVQDENETTTETGVLINSSGEINNLQDGNTPPELPTDIVLEAAPRKSKLSWTLSTSDNVDYYEIYRGLSAEPTTLHYTTTAPTDNYYDQDTDLTIGETYFYRIKVVDTDGNSSDFSQDYTITVPSSWMVSSENGSADGFGSDQNPFLSIQTAVDISINEDTILVYPGTYVENISLFEKIVSVTTPDPLNSASTTIIDGGSNGFPVFAIDGNGSNLGGSTGTLTLSGFTLKNGFSPTSEVSAGLSIKNTSSSNINISLSHLVIEENTASDAAGGSYFYYTDLIEISDVIYRDNSGTSTMGAFNAKFSLERGQFHDNTSNNTTFDFWHNSSTNEYSVIKNTLMRNNNGSGAFNMMDGIIINSTIVDSGQSNVVRGKSALVNTIISSGQFISSTSGLFSIHNSHIEDGQVSIDIFPNFLTYNNNLEGDIYFTDANNSDYSLSEYSPCIGAGINSITLYNVDYDLNSNVDLNSNDRPLPEGTSIDIGAYENSLGSNSHNTAIFVSNEGSNNGSVGLETQPFETIQAAIDYALDGDTIYVLPGTYPGGLSIINKGINFRSTVPLGAIINNNVNNSNTFDFSSNTGTYFSTITGFDINKTSTGGGTGIRAYNNHYVNLYQSKISNFSTATASGISAIQAENCLFTNNDITVFNDNCSTGGTNITPLLKNCTVINSDEIHAACPTIAINVVNSIILISDTNQNAYTSPPSLSKVITNDFNVIPQSNSTWDVAPDGETDIYFTDYTNEDYSLQDFSPAIGYGYFPVTTDITGGNRPLPAGSTLDIGAYENALGNPLNGSPRFDAIENLNTDEDSDTQSINITGVTDGDILENQTLAFSVSTDNDDLFESITISYTQSSELAELSYKPAQDQNGIASISVTLSDDAGIDGGGIDSVTKTFTITVNPVNDEPIITDHTMIVDEGTTLDMLENGETNLLYNAIDVDQDNLEAILVSPPNNGSLVINPDGTFSYTHDGSETVTDSFTFKAIDEGDADSNIATVSITINPVNDPPVVFDHAITVDEGDEATALDNAETSVLYNASDIEDDSLTAIIETAPIHGTLVLNDDGTFLYTHDGSDSLVDSFTYRANDSDLTSEIGTVNITINPINDNIPSDIELSNNSINENEDTTDGFVIGQFTAVDLDLPSDSHSFELITGEGDIDNDSFVINGDNLMTFSTFDFETQQTFSIRVRTTDLENQSFEKVFTIDVLNVNDISFESNLTDSFCQGDTANGSVSLSNITDITGDPIFSWTASNGGLIPVGQESNQNLTGLTDGTYSVVISDDTDFTITQDFQISIIPQYSGLTICYVSSDEVEPSKNRIFINNQGNYNVASYEILRESAVVGQYDVIGALDFDEISFLDNESNNQNQSYNYKVRLVDSCGDVSPDSDFHGTILLQSNISANNSVNLNWTDYQGTNYTTYNIYRKVNEGNFEPLASIASSNNIYNDVDADISSGNLYQYYVAIAVDQCNTDSEGSNESNTVELKSNRISVSDGTASIDDVLNPNQFKIYPNPSSSNLNIQVNNNLNYLRSEIYNILGQVILKTDKKQISTENLSRATYFLRIYTDKGFVVKKFIKN